MDDLQHRNGQQQLPFWKVRRNVRNVHCEWLLTLSASATRVSQSCVLHNQLSWLMVLDNLKQAWSNQSYISRKIWKNLKHHLVCVHVWRWVARSNCALIISIYFKALMLFRISSYHDESRNKYSTSWFLFYSSSRLEIHFSKLGGILFLLGTIGLTMSYS